MSDQIQMALITAGSVLLGAIISAIVSFLVNKRSAKSTANIALADFLAKKISIFEEHKSALLKEVQKEKIGGIYVNGKHCPTEDIKKNSTCISNFNSASSVLEKISHYLSASERDRLFNVKSEIENFLVEEQTVASPTITRILESRKRDQFVRFPELVKQSVDWELQSAVANLESIYKLGKQHFQNPPVRCNIMRSNHVTTLFNFIVFRRR